MVCPWKWFAKEQIKQGDLRDLNLLAFTKEKKKTLGSIARANNQWARQGN